MNITKKNHFNSQVYLKSFEYENRSNEVFCTSRTEQNSKIVWSKIKRPMNVDEICYLEDFFTGFLSKEPDRHTTELLFKRAFEDNWPKIMERINNFPFNLYTKGFLKKTDIFDQMQTETLINFIIHQYRRTPTMRRIVLNKKPPTKEFMLKVKKQSPRISKKQILALYLQETHRKLLELDQPTVRNLLNKIDWQLLINETEIPFITSDAPVVWRDEIAIDDEPAIFFPLSPKFALSVVVNLNRQTNSISLHYADKDLVSKFNVFMKNRAFNENQKYSRLISNKKEVLLNLIK